MRRDAEEQETIRITHQFRSGEALVYDFRGSAGRLTVRVMSRGGNAPDVPQEWRMEATPGKAHGAIVSADWKPTRAEALQDIGKSWGEQRVAQDLPAIDWDSVTRAMTAVRAI
jgi:hypothetical protein